MVKNRFNKFQFDQLRPFIYIPIPIYDPDIQLPNVWGVMYIYELPTF